MDYSDKNLLINHKIYQYNNTIENPKALIDSINNLKEVDWKWYSTKPSNQEYVYNINSYEFAEHKTFKLSMVNEYSQETMHLYKKIYNYIVSYVNHYESKNDIKLKHLTDLVINRNHPGKILGSHVDSKDDPESPKISINVFLNDDYEGGGMTFNHHDLTIKPQAGKVVIYPSTDPYYHESLLITSGMGYNINVLGVLSE